jgi:diacylglycerol kinase family enzyme
MKVILIMNPTSCSGRGQRLWAEWRRGLRERGVAFECVATEYAGHARAAACAAGAEAVVVAVGGDGTINEVLDGAVQSGHSLARMGVLYSGTSPDFCRFHGIPVEPSAALDALVSGRETTVDVARITYRDADGRTQVGHFGCGCNIGLGASVARVANRVRRYLGDTTGTAFAVLRAIAYGTPVDLEVEVDGATRRLTRVHNLSILKNPYIASGLRVTADLRPDDGRLLLLGIRGGGKLGLLGCLPGFYTGSAGTARNAVRIDCTHVTIRADGPVEVEFDGDPHGMLPVDIRVLPRALTLLGGSL